jgi:hypothetical protein
MMVFSEPIDSDSPNQVVFRENVDYWISNNQNYCFYYNHLTEDGKQKWDIWGFKRLLIDSRFDFKFLKRYPETMSIGEKIQHVPSGIVAEVKGVSPLGYFLVQSKSGKMYSIPPWIKSQFQPCASPDCLDCQNEICYCGCGE